MKEAIVTGSGNHIEYHCPNCDGHLFPEGENSKLWNCSRCPYGPFKKPEGNQ